MGMTQFAGLSNKPYYGLNYENLVRTKAKSLPGLYAQAEAEQEQQKSTDLKSQELGLQKTYFENQSDIANKQLELNKQNQTTSQVVGTVSTGLGLYNTYNTVKGSETIGKLLGNGAKPGPSEYGTTGQPVETVSEVPNAVPQGNAPASVPVDYSAGIDGGANAAPGAIEGSSATQAGAEGALGADAGGTTTAQMAAEGATTTGIDGATAASSLGELGVSSYVAPAVAGYYGAKYGPSLGSNETGDFMAKWAGFGGNEKVEKAAGGSLRGAAAGAIAGTVIAPGVGTVVGAVVGGVAGMVQGYSGCIIVTACYGRDSFEVEVTRTYRNRHLSVEQIRGYYMISEKLVPIMTTCPRIMEFVRINLVDRLLEVGKHQLNIGPKPKPLSSLVAKCFLRACKFFGSRKLTFVRFNGEVI